MSGAVIVTSSYVLHSYGTKLNIGLQPDPRASRFGAGYARLGGANSLFTLILCSESICECPRNCLCPSHDYLRQEPRLEGNKHVTGQV